MELLMAQAGAGSRFQLALQAQRRGWLCGPAVRGRGGTEVHRGAAPHVTGAAALHVSDNPDATPEAVARALLDASSPGRVAGPGEGSPNRLLHSRF
nr:hypothetical protein [Streptomyces sp. CNQ085]